MQPPKVPPYVPFFRCCRAAGSIGTGYLNDLEQGIQWQ